MYSRQPARCRCACTICRGLLACTNADPGQGLSIGESTKGGVASPKDQGPPGGSSLNLVSQQMKISFRALRLFVVRNAMRNDGPLQYEMNGFR